MRKHVLLVLMLVFSLTLVSAIEWDNKLSYSTDDLTVNITNSFLGLITTSKIATLRLASHSNPRVPLEVGIGEQVVMWYNMTFEQNYTDAIDSIRFINLRNGEEVTKNYSLVFLGKELARRSNCFNKTGGLGGAIETYCVENGSFYFKDVWKPYTGRTMYRDSVLIGVKVNTTLGELIDVVWTVAGKEITRHAPYQVVMINSLGSATTDGGGNAICFFANSAFNFTAAQDAYVENIGVYASTKSGTVPNVVATLYYAYANHTINGTTVGPSSNTKANADFTAGQVTNFTFSANTTRINAGQEYWINFNCSTPSGGYIRAGETQGAGSPVIWANGATVGTMSYNQGPILTANIKVYGDVIEPDTTTIFLLSPATGTSTNNPTQNFVCNVTNPQGIKNVSLMVNNSRVLSNTSGVNNTNYTFTYTLPSANYYQWTCEATSNSNITTYNLSNFTITYTNALAVNLLSPIDNYNTSSSPVTLIGNASDDTAILNVSLLWNGVREQTNSTGINNTNYSFSKTISSDGTYKFGIEACDANACAITTNRTLTYDTSAPNITIFNPSIINDYANWSQNVYINHTIHDSLLSTCVYSINGGTNQTYTCGNNFTAIITRTNNTVTLWANDTVGNQAVRTYNWSYRFLLINQSYTASTTEGTAVAFNLTVQTNGVDLTSAILNYSGTAYTGSASQTSNNWSVGRYINAPSVSGTTNQSFYWNLTRTDGTFYVFPTSNQTVQDFAIDNCSNMTGRYVLYNFTIVDEESQIKLAPNDYNTSAEFALTIYTADLSTAFGTFSLLYNKTNAFAVCLTTDLSGSTFVADAQVQYQADGYSTEFYNIQRETLTNADINTNITLYDLNSTNAQEFQINYKDSNFIPVENAIIQIYRKYISEDTYKIVEIPITSTDGSTLAHLELSDVIYKFVVIKNGEVLATFNDQLAFCDNIATGDCVINLNAFGSSDGIQDFVQTQGISFSMSYDAPTRTISAPFVIPSGTPATVVMNVTLFDGLGNNSVCTNTKISSTGTLSCAVPQAFENYTVIATITKDGSLVGRGSFAQDQTQQQRFGGSYVFLGLFAILMIIGMGMIDSPVIMAVMLILGVIVLASFGFITNRVVLGVGSTIVFFIIGIIIVLIKGGRRD